jgi:hypothetical protein
MGLDIDIEIDAASAYISTIGQSGNGRGSMPIDLSQPEKELVTGLLEKELDEIRSELHHTQGHDYKDRLREREQLVRGLLAKLTASSTS